MTFAGLRMRFRTERHLLLRGVFVTLLASLASATIGASRIGRILSGITLDGLTRSARIIEENHITLVDITEDDYHTIFHGRRPLDQRIIIELLNGALAGGAKLVAVDIDTEDWLINEKLILPPNAAVVWARNFHANRESARQQLVLDPFLGGAGTAKGECYGVPALAEEAGVVRWYYTGLLIGPRLEPSFVEQIVHRSSHSSCMANAAADDLEIIPFSSHIDIETASTLLAESRSKGWGQTRRYEEKIVVLGGSFHSGADLRDTPIGALSGLEINGQAISSAIRKNARKELGEGWALATDLLVGIMLVLCALFGHRVQLAATFFSILLIGFAAVYLFHQYYLFLSFLPIIVGITIHFRIENRLSH